MNNFEYKKFLEAVDTVCLNCLKCSEENCENCPVRFTCDELNKQIKVGCEYTFKTTDSELKAYNGTKVKVLRPLTEEECDIADVGNMYKAVFNDGFNRDVFEDELSL
jgi:hypothetical protein